VIDHRHVIFVLAVVKVAKRDVTAVRSLTPTTSEVHVSYSFIFVGNRLGIVCKPTGWRS